MPSKLIPDHPYAALVPPMAPDRLQELTDDIIQNGLLEPLTIFEGKVLDGRSRQQACVAAGVAPTTVQFAAANLRGDALQAAALRFVWSRNGARRDLTSGQRELLFVETVDKANRLDAAQAQKDAGKKGGRPKKGEERKPGPHRGVKDIHESKSSAKTAKAVGVGHSTIDRARAVANDPDLRERVRGGHIKTTGEAYKALRMRQAQADPDRPEYPEWLKPFNLWSFTKPDPQFGQDYPGRMPGQVVLNLLWYFTDEGDLVVDPFAGGGTTIDACKYLGRRCVATDLAPARKDIGKNDILKGYPKGAGGAALVLLDPPYWSQKKGEYAEGESQLAGMPLREYNDAMTKIFAASAAVLRPGGHLAVIVSDSRVKGQVYDHAFEFGKTLRSQGWEPIERVIVPYTTQQTSPQEIAGAKKQRRMLRLYRDLIIVRKSS